MSHSIDNNALHFFQFLQKVLGISPSNNLWDEIWRHIKWRSSGTGPEGTCDGSSPVMYKLCNKNCCAWFYRRGRKGGPRAAPQGVRSSSPGRGKCNWHRVAITNNWWDLDSYNKHTHTNPTLAAPPEQPGPQKVGFLVHSAPSFALPHDTSASYNSWSWWRQEKRLNSGSAL